jgi:hypothetical protein
MTQEDATPGNYEHYTVGLNPAREDGTWLTEEEALRNFALQFCKAMSKAQGRMMYVRLKPELTQTHNFDEDMPTYLLVGRFSVKMDPPVGLREGLSS